MRLQKCSADRRVLKCRESTLDTVRDIILDRITLARWYHEIVALIVEKVQWDFFEHIDAPVSTTTGASLMSTEHDVQVPCMLFEGFFRHGTVDPPCTHPLYVHIPVGFYSSM